MFENTAAEVKVGGKASNCFGGDRKFFRVLVEFLLGFMQSILMDFIPKEHSKGHERAWN